MPRLTLTASEAADWPTLDQCTTCRVGTTQGYTRVAERGQWHPYAGRHGLGYVRSLGPHNGSSRYQTIMYRLDPSSSSREGLAAARRYPRWSRYQTC